MNPFIHDKSVEKFWNVCTEKKIHPFVFPVLKHPMKIEFERTMPMHFLSINSFFFINLEPAVMAVLVGHSLYRFFGGPVEGAGLTAVFINRPKRLARISSGLSAG